MGNRKNNNASKMVLIYVRYLLPVVLCLALLGTMLIPCLQYSTVEGTQKEISALELMENSWDQVRAYLFATSDQEITQVRFSWTVLILLPVLVLFFLIGAVMTVAVAVGAMRYINNYAYRKTDARIWFITIIPNRIVVCAVQALILPMLFYSRMIIPLYTKVLHVGVLLNVSFPEPWVWGLIAYAVIVALTVISARFERELDADPFKKIKRPVVRVVDPEKDEPAEEEEPKFTDEAARRYYENQKRAREEQAELIRRLLNKNNEEEK